MCPKELEMFGPKISFDGMVQPTEADLKLAHACTMDGPLPWLSFSKEARAQSSIFKTVFGACLEVLDLLGEAALYVEVIKVTPRLRYIDDDKKVLVTFEVYAVLNRGGSERSPLILFDPFGPNEEEVGTLKQKLYDAIRSLIKDRIRSAEGVVRERLEHVLPAERVIG